MPIRLGKIWVKRPLFPLAVALVLALLLDAWQPGLAWLGVLVATAIGTVFAGWRGAALFGVIAAIGLGNSHFRESRRIALEKGIGSLGLQVIEARLVEDAEGEDGSWAANARLSTPGLPAAKVRWIGSGEPAAAGTEFRASGVFRPLEAERNPGVPDGRERLRNEGVVADFQASEMRSERWIGPFSRGAHRVKSGFRDAITAGLEPDGQAAQVIRAVVVGERSRDSLELVRHFRESGTLHVFTVSGMHVMMVGSMMWFFLKWMGVERRRAVPFIVAVMFGYAWLTGNGPAAVRSAWMGAVFLGAFVFKRDTDLLNALGAVLLVTLLWDPRMIRMPGVQLSYGVVASIGLATFFARKCFAWIAVRDDLLPVSETGWWRTRWLRSRQWLADALAVSAAASLGSLPLTLFHFGIVTPVSVFATVALVAQVYVLLGLSLISAAISPLAPSFSRFLNQGNALVADSCAGTAKMFSELPGAWFSPGIRREEGFIIYDLAYGNSAAVFVSAEGNAILIDAGGNFALDAEVGPSLRNLGISPDSAIFTHEDAGHIAGPGPLREMFPIQQIAMPPLLSKSSVASEWKNEDEISKIYPAANDKLDLGGGAYAEILFSPITGNRGSVADDRSLVMMIHWKGSKILWLGDAGRPTEEALLEAGSDLRADAIVAGFHGSDASLTPEFVAGVAPRVILIPRPPDGGSDTLRQHLREAGEEHEIHVIDQNKSGGVTVTMNDSGKMIFCGFLDGSETEIVIKN